MMCLRCISDKTWCAAPPGPHARFAGPLLPFCLRVAAGWCCLMGPPRGGGLDPLISYFFFV